MKALATAIAVLGGMVAASAAFAAPALTAPAATNVGANMATLVLKSSGTGTGYFTLLSGSYADCGTGNQVKAGQTAAGATAPFAGSMPLTADTYGYYTVRNLAYSSAYTVCFTAESPAGSGPSVPVATNLTTNLAAALGVDWRTVGATGFSAADAYSTSLAFAPDGTSHVAYMDAANGYKATVMKFDGNGWILVGNAGFSSGGADLISLMFAPDGTPYVAFQDWGNGGKATVMRYFDGTWSVAGSAGFSSGAASSVSLAFGSDGTPHVAFGDEGNSGKVTVMKFNGAAWGVAGSAGFSAGTANSVSLAFAPDGVPYVAYGDDGNGGKATVMKFSGGSWIAAGNAGFSTGIAGSTSLAIAHDGTPHVAYSDYGSSGKASVKRLSGGVWEYVGTEGGFSAWEAEHTSLAIGPNGVPYVGYSDYANSGKATVMAFSGGSWDVVGSAGFSAGVASNVSLSMAPTGAPCAAYADAGNNGIATMMRLKASPSIAGAPATTASVGMPYAFTPAATDADSFSLTGILPPGLNFSAATGAVTGTPNSVGTYDNISITAVNSLGSAALPAFSIAVTNTTPPDTTITSFPGGSPSFSFAFTSTQSGSSFECSVQGGGYFSCSSPYAGSSEYADCAICRTESPATFAVRAIGPAGSADPTPATHVWTIQHPVVAPFDHVAEGGTVQLRATDLTGNLNLTRSVAYSVKGGYDSGYSGNGGMSVIHGTVAISAGTVDVENLVIMP